MEGETISNTLFGQQTIGPFAVKITAVKNRVSQKLRYSIFTLKELIFKAKFIKQDL